MCRKATDDGPCKVFYPKKCPLGPNFILNANFAIDLQKIMPYGIQKEIVWRNVALETVA